MIESKQIATFLDGARLNFVELGVVQDLEGVIPEYIEDIERDGGNR